MRYSDVLWDLAHRLRLFYISAYLITTPLYTTFAMASIVAYVSILEALIGHAPDCPGSVKSCNTCKLEFRLIWLKDTWPARMSERKKYRKIRLYGIICRLGTHGLLSLLANNSV